MADTHICTNCGYEGKPVRPPSDHSEDDESFIVVILNKLIFAFTFMPIKVGWIVRLVQRGKVKNCPNCGLPLMVKLSSDAGFVAKRRQDLKAGVRYDKPEAPAVVFGKEIVLPSDEIVPTYVPPPTPENLPHLDDLLKPENTSTPAPEPDKAAQEKLAATPPKKPVDPDQW